ncbi:MAG: hypothetical protein A2Z83_06715 [Omnitrophica bacterium GWA2_52_8]|nr:MAG: hypothetical protein A2Z83_06715 [Omnitrophica bacterium GWA2_52_8]
MPTLPIPQSSIGKKAVMAVTGLMMFGFILGHLAGNLLIYAGPDTFNAYAKKLQSLGEFLWVARCILLTALLFHVLSAIQLTFENRKARPIGYRRYDPEVTTYAARTMMLSGIILTAFIVYHLLHFTFRLTHPEVSNLHDARGNHHVYAMVVQSFRQWPVAVAYIAAMVPLCLHLSHGISSAFQSLGLQNNRLLPVFKNAARGIALLIFVGYASIPAACLSGLIQYTAGRTP